MYEINWQNLDSLAFTIEYSQIVSTIHLVTSLAKYLVNSYSYNCVTSQMKLLRGKFSSCDNSELTIYKKRKKCKFMLLIIKFVLLNFFLIQGFI